MATLNTGPTPVANPNYSGYSEVTPVAATATNINQSQQAQAQYDQALANANGNVLDPSVQAALANLNAVNAQQAAAATSGTAASNASYQNIAGVVGTGSGLFGEVTSARQQNTLDQQRRSVNNRDWRVRLQLAPQADYLYMDPTIQANDLLYPLKVSNGLIFPYTPSISVGYSAAYNPVQLTHTNYTNYFYTGSSVGAVTLTGTFTAQDTFEANYLLAAIHFLRSATKMFYGQDAQAGAPPPLLYLTGFGENQFLQHQCVLQTFNYSLPSGVDYVRAGSFNQDGGSLLTRRGKTSVPNNSLSSTIARLTTLGVKLGIIKGANPNQSAQSIFNTQLGGDRPTYVPTSIEIQITLLPVQSRSQVSKEFSVKAFANGNLLRGGFW